MEFGDIKALFEDLIAFSFDWTVQIEGYGMEVTEMEQELERQFEPNIHDHAWLGQFCVIKLI